MLRRIRPDEVVRLARSPVDAEAIAAAAPILAEVRASGMAAVRAHAERLGDLGPGETAVLDRGALDEALHRTDREARAVLERTADRIRAFASAQGAALTETRVAIPGGEAGTRVDPVDRAGCYAPGGRYPLPSTVLMTAITARVAGVGEVWVASPRPSPLTLAAAAVAGADALLAVGGAQAIAAFAYGAAPVPAMDVVVGPGNRWVTAAKQLVAGRVGIDMLAGPSELVVVADEHADPATVAADLLAQAEHDDEALPVLVAIAADSLLDAVDLEIARQLATLPTAGVAKNALRKGFAVRVGDVAEAAGVVDRLAPEHLELMLRDASADAQRFRHWGGLFVGSHAAEVLGDYGAGPNHVLPTGGTARFCGGLSVHSFLRVHTWMRIDRPEDAQPLVEDAVALARWEGLEAHARSALRRRSSGPRDPQE